jgi:hypothetical protein
MTEQWGADRLLSLGWIKTAREWWRHPRYPNTVWTFKAAIFREQYLAQTGKEPEAVSN